MTDELPPQIQAVADRLSESWGETVDVGPGWFDLLAELHERLDRLSPGYAVQQCKTKYGGLRYYANPADTDDVDTQMTFNEIIRAAEDKSLSVCEDCGSAGHQVTLHGWIWTLCTAHTQQRRQETARDE
mgnify:CR=1 FL=1